ncbi:MAG: Protein kinase [Acidobacteria bacterium]|nr:Protein kinase [Acidobacteriota bacterium]
MSARHPESVGRYRILGEVGRGAMGAVYRAEDPKLGRVVAVKMIAAAAAGGDDRGEIAARFEREARVAARLHHPNVVAIHDVGSEGDSLYLVMELVEGESLAHRLARGEFPAPERALEIAAQAADALAAAHEAGIVHRDVKPANLLIDRHGRVKVSDFGVAKAVGERTELTRTGMMVGSPAYMAPEQVKGMPLDGRSDLFSLGVVLFEMLLRRKPFPADTVTTLVYQILHEDPLEDAGTTASISTGLALFLRWTLAKDREARIPDARTFAARARQLAAGGALAAPVETAPTALLARSAAVPASVPAPAPAGPAPLAAPTGAAPARARTGLWMAVGAAAVLALAVAVAIGLMSRSPAVPEVGRAEPVAAFTASPLPQPAAPAPEPVVPKPAPKPEPKPEPAPEPLLPDAPAVAPAAPALAAAAAPEPAVAVPEPAPPPAPAVPIESVFETRRAAEFHVDPEDALVTVDGSPIGVADDWDDVGGGKQYVFPGPGEYLVQLSLAGYRTAWIKIVVSPGAKRDVANVDTNLDEIDN